MEADRVKEGKILGSSVISKPLYQPWSSFFHVGENKSVLSLFSSAHWGIDLDYCDTEWFALERNRDHSVIFEIASNYCIWDSFVNHDGYSTVLKGKVENWVQQTLTWHTQSTIMSIKVDKWNFVLGEKPACQMNWNRNQKNLSGRTLFFTFVWSSYTIFLQL